MTWSALFERAAAADVDVTAVSDALESRRADRANGEREREDDGGTDGRENGGGDGGARTDAGVAADPSPARVVADADVLAADLLVGGAARDALDCLRRHSWTTLVASDALVEDAEAVIATLADSGLATDWREKMDDWRESVTHPAGDHPALASAYRGGAMQVLSFDERLTSPTAGTALQGRFPVSVREPRAFATVFDAGRLHAEVVGGDYPGPDRDPRR